MKTKKQDIAKYLRMYAIGIWGVLSVLYIAGEPIDEEISFGTFCMLKLIGLTAVGLSIYVGACLRRKGLLPEVDDDN